MIHEARLKELLEEYKKDKFVYPAYGKYSLAEIAPSIEKLFGLNTTEPSFPFLIAKNKPKKVIFLVIDGFSYKHLSKYSKDIPFLKKLVQKAEIYPITSVFPSTTPAALTTITTGHTPQEHGLPEWTVYFEEFDSIIETLPFKTWEMQEQDGLLKIGGVAEMLYEGNTLFENLKKAKINSFSFTSYKYSHSAYSQMIQKGSHFIPYLSVEGLFSSVAELAPIMPDNTFFYLYYGLIDSAAHQFGPESKEHVSELTHFFNNLEEQFLRKMESSAKEDILFIITSDHGVTNIKGNDIINLNKYTFLEDNFMKGKNGKKILPTGSPHDVMLFINPDMVSKIVEFLKGELNESAEVLTTSEAVNRGLFGINKPNNKFLRRIGNVLILPYPGFHVWYQFIPNAEYHFLGMHGGLSEEEMIIPFIFCPLSSLA